MIMILRQQYPERCFDTKIPFITGNLEIPFLNLPQLFIGTYYLLCYIFEAPFISGYELRLPIAAYYAWLYLRFVTGDPSTQAHFALHTFLPLSYQPGFEVFTTRLHSVINDTTGLFDYL